MVTPSAIEPRADEFDLQIAEWSIYRGFLRARLTVRPRTATPKYVYFVQGVRAVRFRLRPDVENEFEVRSPDPDVGLAFSLSRGRVVSEPQPAAVALAGDESSLLFERFIRSAAELPAGRALELGSRARSGTTYREFLPAHVDYVGLDIREGPNVDVVGDAHELPSSFDEGSFNLVFCIAVFEHLAMPWKAALSINRVLADGGLFFAGTHQTFPVHEAPWDFWRYSDRAWHSLFNRATGFEIIATAMGQPADIVPHATLASVAGIDNQPAFLTSSVLARKIGEPTVQWDVSLSDLKDEGVYPH
ncbi:MAG: hypothetical protein QOI61_1921 [Actinomycetota bacterium]